MHYIFQWYSWKIYERIERLVRFPVVEFETSQLLFKNEYNISATVSNVNRGADVGKYRVRWNDDSMIFIQVV